MGANWTNWDQLPFRDDVLKDCYDMIQGLLIGGWEPEPWMTRQEQIEKYEKEIEEIKKEPEWSRYFDESGGLKR